jgi:hypothetical protein
VEPGQRGYGGTKLRSIYLAGAVAGASLSALAFGAPSRSSGCITDTEIEAAFGDELRAGVFAVRTDKLGDRPLCSGLPMAEAIQRLRVRIVQTRPQASSVDAQARRAESAVSPEPRANLPMAGLDRYDGKYNHDKVGGYIFLQNPAVVAALTRAGVPPKVRLELGEYAVSSPISTKRGIIVSQGCFPHSCGDMHYKIYVNPRTGVAALCHFEAGGNWYSIASQPRPLTSSNPCPELPGAAPAAVRESLSDAGSPIPAAQPDAGSGRIWGEFSYPSDFIPDDITACAEEITTARETCVRRNLVQGSRVFYSVTVSPGRYRVYARSADAPGKKAYYTKAVVCGGDARCRDHTPVVLNVTSGSVHSGIDPQDWYAD